MKNKNLILSFLAMFFGLSLVFSSQFVLGQDSKSDKEVKVKIVQNINGETKTIEQNFSAQDEDALKELLKEFDVTIDEKELADENRIEINIHKTETKAEDEDVVVKIERIVDNAQEGISPKAFLGVILDDIETEDSKGDGSSEKQGVVVAKVLDESTAEKAGIREGDLITRINDTEITGSSQFQDVIRSFQPGEEITIHYQRDGKGSSVKAELGEKMISDFHDGDYEWHGQMPPMMRFQHMEEMKERPFLGVVPGTASDETTLKEGVIIGEVIEKSTAAEMGLQKGDIIVEINDKPVNSFEKLRENVRNTKVGDELKVEWKRDGKAMKASGPIKSKADCKAICMEKERMAHCGDMVKEFRYKLDDSNEMNKEILEKTIEQLEGEIQNLKEQLNRLSDSEENSSVKTEETKVTITIEDVLENDLKAENLLFSPNPNNGKFALSFELSGKGKTTVRIFDVTNKEIYNESLEKFSGRYDKQIDISENPKGIYFLQITQDHKALNKKILIQ